MEDMVLAAVLCGTLYAFSLDGKRLFECIVTVRAGGGTADMRSTAVRLLTAQGLAYVD